jgi:predicted nucleotide-binding protein
MASSSDRPRLAVSRERAEEILNRHITDGYDLLENAKAVQDENQSDEWGQTRQRWVSLTDTALGSIFSTDAPAQEFTSCFNYPWVVTSGTPWSNFFAWDRSAVERAINVLVSLGERLEYMEAPEPADGDGQLPGAEETGLAGDQTRPVFIVHGRNEERKTQVARLLEKTGQHPVTILHEQPNRGRTLLEKFEEHAGESAYGVVLLTADDLGALRPAVADAMAKGDDVTNALEPRSRQNVVFELGYFFGMLGRQHVAVLHDEGVELPSDIGGLVYIPLDAGGAWQAKLLLELRSAGFAYDMNLLT